MLEKLAETTTKVNANRSPEVRIFLRANTKDPAQAKLWAPVCAPHNSVNYIEAPSAIQLPLLSLTREQWGREEVTASSRFSTLGHRNPHLSLAGLFSPVIFLHVQLLIFHLLLDFFLA